MLMFFNRFATKFLDKVAPVMPEFSDDLSKLDVMDRWYSGKYVPEKFLVENGLDVYPVEIIERCYKG